MNLSTLEQIVGPINRGQLAGKFKHELGKHHQDEDYEFVPVKQEKAPPLEDLSHLNPSYGAESSRRNRMLWKKLTPAQRKRRIAHNIKAGKLGGGSNRDSRIMNPI